jgi:outer membrane protein assembly factor BamB
LIVVAVVPIAMFLAVVAGCGGNGRDRPAYDATDTSARWANRARGGSHALVVDGDTVCSTQARELYCLDAVSGDEIFAEQLPGAATSPSLAGETLVVGDHDADGGRLHAYSLSGRHLWSLELDGDVFLPGQSLGSGLLVAGDVVVRVHGTGPSQELVAVDVASGQEQWRLPVPDMRAVYADGHRLYTTSGRGSLVALDPGSGDQLWQAHLGEGAGSGDVVGLAPVLEGAEVAVAVDGEPGRIVVLDPVSGTERWDEDLHADTAADVTVASTDDVIYVNDDDFLTAYDETGEDHWGAPAAGSTLGPGTPVRLVAERGRLFTIGDGVWDISTRGGSGRQMREDVNASDVAVVEDSVIIAGATRLEAVPLVQR